MAIDLLAPYFAAYNYAKIGTCDL